MQGLLGQDRAAASPTGNGRRLIQNVLLVEDNPGDARLLRETLFGEGSFDTQLTRVATMAEAETHLAAHPVDVALLDLGLPDAQGLEALRRIQLAAPHVPVVVLTGLDDESVALAALQEGAQDFLVKGQIETRGLLRAVRYAVERKVMEERHRSVMENSNDAILMMDQALQVLEANRCAEELLGCPRPRIVGRSYQSFVAPSDRGRFDHDRERLLETGSVRVFDRHLLRADGSLTTADVSISLIRNGREIVVLAVLQDTSARKRVERRLVENEEEYQILFDSNPHAMWVFDIETLVFLAVNDAAIRLYGYSRDEFLAMTIKDIRPPEEVPALLQAVATMPDTPSLIATQVRHRKKDGTLLEVAGASNPIEFRGRRARLVLANDVSERKGLEAQLVQAQKMEAVGRLAGGVAHDFNNLLGVITGYSELLLTSLGPGHSGARRVVEIQKAAARAAALTRQLLAFSRKQVTEARVLDLNAVVADVEKMLRRVIGDDVQFVSTAGAGLGRVFADAGQVEQVLMNLVVNARDAMPTGGRLSLETANVDLDAAYARAHPEVEPGSFVMLSVGDTGEGMDADTQSHIFEPFFTTKEEGKGTGLGLATVFGIVKQAGGSIEVRSKPGKGSAFRIYFPRVEGDLSRAQPAAGSGPIPGGNETLLLVEDADSLRVIVREILESAGYRVLECSDPEEALLRITDSDDGVDLILTDVVMPRLSGPDLVKGARASRPTLKVVFMSGYTNDAVGLHGLLGSDTQFIQKPFASDALLQKVRETLDGTVRRVGG